MILSSRFRGLGVAVALMAGVVLTMPLPVEAQCLVTTAPSLFDPSPAAWAARPNTNFAPLPTSIAFSEGTSGKRLVTRWNYGFAIYNAADPARPTFAFHKDMMAEGYPKNGDGSDRTGNVSISADGKRIAVPWTDDAGYGTVVEIPSGGGYATAGDYVGHVSLMAPSYTAVLTYGSRYLGFTLATGSLVVADITSVQTKPGAGTPGSLPSERVPNVVPFRFSGMTTAQGSGKSFLVINAQTEVIVVDVSNPGPAGAALPSNFSASFLPPSAFYPTGTTVPTKISTVAAAIHPVDKRLYIAVEGGSTTSQGIALARFDEDTQSLTRRGLFLPQAPLNGLTSAAAMVPWDTDVVAFFVSKGTSNKKLHVLSGADFSQDLASDALLPLAMPTGNLTAIKGAGTKAYFYGGDSNEAWSGAVDCTLSSAGAIPSISVEKVTASGSVALANGAQVFVGDELKILPRYTSTSVLETWRIDADLHAATEKSVVSPFLSWPDLTGGFTVLPPTTLKMFGPCDPRGPGGASLDPTTQTDWSWCWTSATTNDGQGGPDFEPDAPAGTEKTTQIGFEAANEDNGTNDIPPSRLATFDVRWKIPAVRVKAESILTGDVLADGSEGTPLATGRAWYFATAPGGDVLARDASCDNLASCNHSFPGNGIYAYHLKVPYRGGYSSPDCVKAGEDCVAPPVGAGAFRTITLADVALAFTVPANIYRSQGAIPAQSASRKGAVSGSFKYQICKEGSCASLPAAVSIAPSGDPFSVTSPGSLSIPMPAQDGTYRLRIGYTYSGTQTCTTGDPCTVYWPTPSDDAGTWASVNVSPVEPYIVLTGTVTKFGSDYQMYVGDTAKAWAYVDDAADPNPPSGLLWTFTPGKASTGASTSTAQGASFSYPTTLAAGVYTITLDGYGPRQSLQITVDPKPTGGGGGGGGGGSTTTPPTVKSFGANPGNPSPGQQVTLTCSATQGTYAITGYVFTFGDGTPSESSSSNVTTHTWSTAGEYSVSCKARDSQGTLSTARTIALQVGTPVGACDFSIKNDAGSTISFDPTTQIFDATAGQPLTFAATGVVGTVSWNFGNGATATGNPTVYTFPAASSPTTPFTVTMTSSGCTRAYEVFVSAGSGPAPISFRVLDDVSGVELAKSGQNYEASSGQRLRFVAQGATEPVQWTFGDATTSTTLQPVKWFEPLIDTTYVVTLAANGQTKQRSIVVKGSTGAPLTATFNFVYADGTPVSRTAVQPNKAIRFTAIDQADSYQWDFGDGSPLAQGSPRDYTFTRAGTFSVRLTTSRPGVTPVTTPSPLAFTVLAPPDPLLWVAGGMAYVEGSKGELFQSDLSVFNPGSQAATVSLAFVSGAGWDGVSKAEWRTLGIGPGETRAFSNVLSTFFNLAKGAWGVVLVRGDSVPVAPVIVSRTYNSGDPESGTFGLSVPTMSVAAGVRPQSGAASNFLAGLRHDDAFRTNITIANLKEETAEVEIVFRDAAGNVLGTPARVRVEARGVKQLNAALSSAPPVGDGPIGGAGWATPTSHFSAEVRLKTGTGVYPYATVIDQGTGDSIVVTPAPRPSAAYRIPGIVRVKGKNGPFWVSDIAILNPSAKERRLRISYSYVKTGTSLRIDAAQSMTFAPYEMKVGIDFVKVWLGLDETDEHGYASSYVDVSPAPDDAAPTEPVVVSGKTYTPSGEGSVGLQIDPFVLQDGIGAQAANRRIVLSGLSANSKYRTNVALFLTPGSTGNAQVDVHVLDAYGRESKKFLAIGLDANTPFVQLNSPDLFAGLVTDDYSRATVVIDTPRGSALVAAYATVIDDKSEDATFVAGQPAP